MDVIVVGGGTSGLAAAHHLKQQGADYLVLEAKEMAGGRIIGAERDGFILDLGAQFFFKFYDTTFSLCRELGLGGDIVPFPFKTALWNRGRLYPMIASLDPRELWKHRQDVMRFRGLSNRASLQMAKIMPLVLKRRKDLHFIDFQRILDLDEESLADLALRLAGRDILDEFMQPLASCLTLGEPEDIGAGYGLTLLWYSLNGLFTLRRGIGTLATALYEENRDRVRLNMPVERIVIDKGKVRGVRAGGELIEADRVICALTATRALEVMPDLPEELAGTLRRAPYSACCHVMFGLNKRVMPEGWYAVSTSRKYGLSMAGFTDNSIKSPYYAPPKAGIMHCFTYGRYARELNEKSDSEVKRQLIGEIRTMLPAMPDEPRFTEIYRWDEAVCMAPPGLLREMAGLRRDRYRAVEGLFLAGEYFYMPSVDGSLHSGLEAARECLR